MPQKSISTAPASRTVTVTVDCATKTVSPDPIVAGIGDEIVWQDAPCTWTMEFDPNDTPFENGKYHFHKKNPSGKIKKLPGTHGRVEFKYTSTIDNNAVDPTVIIQW